MNPDATPAPRSEQGWLKLVRTAALRGDLATAQTAVARARAEHPGSIELQRLQAGIWQQAGNRDEAEALLRELLASSPWDVAAAFALARLLREQGRMAGAATTLRTCFDNDRNLQDPDLAISAIELLDKCDRKADAAAIAQAAITAHPDDTRLPAYAGMLQMQLGHFESARRHYLFALQHDVRAWEWHAPIGLSAAQRYASGEHPDFALFQAGLERSALSEKARAELHFALGKAHDDIDDREAAVRHFRQGNAIMHRLTRWSRKAWRRSIDARLGAAPLQQVVQLDPTFVPVFIVGVPRSGTTLLAELLSRHPQVRNRGELPWVAELAQRDGLLDSPDTAALRRAAADYSVQSRQDDAGASRWFIDKQPLNFRYIDVMLAMFPAARIIHCQRDARDVALSLWKLCFTDSVQDYAYDFEDITLVLRDCGRLLAHWRARFADSIRTIRYEDLVSDPTTTVAALAHWIGLPEPPADAGVLSDRPASQISTASLWQARQPVNARSVGRWRHYAAYLPELERIAQS